MAKQSRMKSRIGGFTLIELLVVIAIIALLLSILMPSLSGARRMAKSSVCLSNLKRIGIGMALYMNKHSDRFPPFRLKKSRPSSDQGVYVNKWKRAKPRWQWFVDSDEVGPIIDPSPFRSEIDSTGSFGDSSVGAHGESGREMTSAFFTCPSLKDDFEFDIRNGAYGYNYQYLGNSRQDADDGDWDNFPVSATRVRATGRTVLIADSRGAGRTHGKHSYSLDPPRLAVERRADRFGPGGGDLAPGLSPDLYQYSPVEMRHGAHGNVLFVDSHAVAMNLADLGYELNERQIPVPVLDSMNGSYRATNKLWTGSGQDRLAVAHQP